MPVEMTNSSGLELSNYRMLKIKTFKARFR